MDVLIVIFCVRPETNMGPNGAKKLAPALEHLTKLTILHFGGGCANKKIQDWAAFACCNCCFHARVLQWVRFDTNRRHYMFDTCNVLGNKIGTSGVKALAPNLGYLTQLVELQLQGEWHPPTGKEVQVLLRRVQCRVCVSSSCAVPFVFFVTSDNNMGASGAKSLAQSLGKLSLLKTLHLHRE